MIMVYLRNCYINLCDTHTCVYR